MIEALKRAIELAQQLPEDEQHVLAPLMLEEMQGEARWEQGLSNYLKIVKRC